MVGLYRNPQKEKCILPKRCPKCGRRRFIMAKNTNRWFRRYMVVCETQGCWNFGRAAHSEDGAIKKWNKER